MKPPVQDRSATSQERLESWKEIAAFLGKGVRTVQRWERTEDLPVRRHVHERGGTVYAYKSEVLEWYRSRQTRLETELESEAGNAGETALPPESPPRSRPALGLKILLSVVAVLAAS